MVHDTPVFSPLRPEKLAGSVNPKQIWEALITLFQIHATLVDFILLDD